MNVVEKNCILFTMKRLPLILLLGQLCWSQDFGFTYYSITDFRSLGASYNLQQFVRTSTNVLADSQSIQFSTALPLIEYRELNSRIAIGYQEYSLAGKTLSSFSVFIESGNDYPVTGREQQNGFFIPMMLSANYVKAETPYKQSRNFDIGSLGAGSGVKYRVLTKDFGMYIAAKGALHFSNVGFGTEYGSMTTVAGEIQFILPNVLFEGMIFGYRYERQQWNMNDSSLDYKRYYHGLYVGFFF